jgi:hypothetical protein
LRASQIEGDAQQRIGTDEVHAFRRRPSPLNSVFCGLAKCEAIGGSASAHMTDQESVDALKQLARVLFRAFGVGVVLAFGGFYAVHLSRFTLGFPAFNPHGGGDLLLAALSVLGCLAWLPVAIHFFLDRRGKGQASTRIDSWLLALNGGCLALFGILWNLGAL